MYGGTKEELQRLLKDAEKLTGQKYDISNFADIIKAIKAVQDEMGITGTTAKEASETIQGSALAMKAAWQNFVTGMADDDADFDQLLSNLLDSVQTFLKNIIPRIKKMLPRLVRGLTEIAKAIGKELPGIMDDLLPALVEGAADLLGSMWNVLQANAGTFKTIGLSIIKAIYKGFTGEEMPDDMFNTIKGKIDEVAEAVNKILSGLIDFGTKLMTALGPALIWVADMAVVAFCWIGENIDWLLPILGSLLGAMLAFKAVKKVTGIVQGFMGLFSLGGGKGGGALGEALGGGSGGGAGGMFGPKNVAKALGSIAIAIGGITAIVAAYAALKQIPGYDDFMAGGGDAMKQLCDIITDIGLVGAAFVGFTALVGKGTSIAEAADGIGSVAVALLGMEAIVAAFAALAQIEGYTDFMAGGGTAMKQLCGIIEDIALVGGAFVTFVSLVGTFGGIATAGNGMLAVAAALGGMEAVVLAFGAIAQIPGIDTFMNEGGQMLTELCSIIGEMAGSIIGGIGEGITASLSDIGDNITAFARSISPAMTAFSLMDYTALGGFASAFGEFMLVMAGDKLLSVITGEINYAALGTNLSAMATNLSGFFNAIKDFSDDGFAKATALFDCLAGISSMPKEGGVVGWFEGEVDYAAMALGMRQLATAAPAFNAIQDIPDAAFTKMAALFECLAGVKSMPSEGGFFDKFTGEATTGLKNLSEALPDLATSLQGFYDNVPDVENFDKISSLFNALASVKELPTEGGFFDLFTGDATTGLKNVLSALSEIGDDLALFYTKTAEVADFTKLGSLFTELAKVNDIAYIDPYTTGLGAITNWMVDVAANCGGFFTLIGSLNAAGLNAFITFLTDAAAIESGTGFGVVCEGIKSIGSEGAGFFAEINGLNTSNMDNFVRMLTALCELPPTLATLGETLKSALAGFADAVSTNFTSIEEKTQSTATVIAEQMTRAVTSVRAAITAIKAAFNQTITGPKVKLPHVSVSGAFSLNPPSAPKFSVSWYKEGGILTQATIFGAAGNKLLAGGEAGAEAVVPLKTLWDKLETMIYSAVAPTNSYSPESDATAIYNSGGNSEIINVSPIFNLTVSGSTDDRATARRIKRYVAQAITETFESMERTGHLSLT